MAVLECHAVGSKHDRWWMLISVLDHRVFFFLSKSHPAIITWGRPH